MTWIYWIWQCQLRKNLNQLNQKFSKIVHNLKVKLNHRNNQLQKSNLKRKSKNQSSQKIKKWKLFSLKTKPWIISKRSSIVSTTKKSTQGILQHRNQITVKREPLNRNTKILQNQIGKFGSSMSSRDLNRFKFLKVSNKLDRPNKFLKTNLILIYALFVPNLSVNFQDKYLRNLIMNVLIVDAKSRKPASINTFNLKFANQMPLIL